MNSVNFNKGKKLKANKCSCLLDNINIWRNVLISEWKIETGNTGGEQDEKKPASMMVLSSGNKVSK